MRIRALGLLRQAIGQPQAEFRDGQWEAIEALVERRARLLLVQRTGWGKSIVYFLAAKLLRERGAGCALLISPLLALRLHPSPEPSVSSLPRDDSGCTPVRRNAWGAPTILTRRHLRHWYTPPSIQATTRQFVSCAIKALDDATRLRRWGCPCRPAARGESRQ